MIKIIKNNIIIIIVIPLLVFFLIFLKNSNKQDVFTEAESAVEHDTTIEQLIDEDDVLTGQADVIVVDIKGEVKHPGIYEFEGDARINDLVMKAGGFLQTADETQVNLAQKLQDEMIVIVPAKGDEQHVGATDMSSSQEQLVKVNYASTDQLETLPGIGPAKAKAIIDYREEHGLFKTKEDLLNISGIGEKTLENIEQYIQVP